MRPALLSTTHLDPRSGRLILDLRDDPAARLAARQYARACAKRNPEFARVIITWLDTEYPPRIDTGARSPFAGN